jgi:hypothetical protein
LVESHPRQLLLLFWLGSRERNASPGLDPQRAGCVTASAENWQAWYQGDLQGFYFLLIAPLAFIVYRSWRGRDEHLAPDMDATRLVSGLTLIFTGVAILDLVATGPLTRMLGWKDDLAGTLTQFSFVWLGDFRVFLLIFAVAAPGKPMPTHLAHAAGWTLIVPIVTGLAYTLMGWLWPEMPGQTLWILYESGFLLISLYLALGWIQGDNAIASYLRGIAAYSATYYALWLLADLLIVAGELDAGWALRALPNQLYYAFWAPFAFFSYRRLSSSDPNASR